VRTYKFLTAALCSALFASGVAPSANAETFVVIVNAENSYSQDGDVAKQQVRRLFLKEQSSWPGNIEATPLSREAGAPAEVAFLANVLGMTQAELESHWLHLKQTQGDTPPRAVGSTRILSRLISKTPGAFGVVLKSATDSMEGVRVLFEFDG